MISNAMTTMLTEFVPKRSSSGVAVTNLLRNSLACGAVVVAEPLMASIGNGWLFTGVSVICWASGIVIIVLKRNAGRWSKVMAEELVEKNRQ
jgi:hypothetical protein